MATATIPWTKTDLADAMLVTWANLDGDDVGAAWADSRYGDRCIQVTGTFDSATVTLQGSNDGTNWQTLTDPQGNAITFTSANRIEQIMERPRYTRPSISGGGASTALTVMIFAARGIR